MKGGGESPKPVPAPAAPTETDPAVQKKMGQRRAQARYAQGFRSTIASGAPDQALGSANPTAGAAQGQLTKLG